MRVVYTPLKEHSRVLLALSTSETQLHVVNALSNIKATGFCSPIIEAAREHGKQLCLFFWYSFFLCMFFLKSRRRMEVTVERRETFLRLHLRVLPRTIPCRRTAATVSWRSRAGCLAWYRRIHGKEHAAFGVGGRAKKKKGKRELANSSTT